MQKRSWAFIILLLNNFAFAADDIDPIVKTFIHKYYLERSDRTNLSLIRFMVCATATDLAIIREVLPIRIPCCPI